MKEIANQTFDAERAFYAETDITVTDCRFDGPADGESAFKECSRVAVDHCYFNLRYPFWHDNGLTIMHCEMTELCRAALWYSEKIAIKQTQMHGIKALRECKDITISDCDIVSPEYGWSSVNVSMQNTSAESEYFMMRGEKLHFTNVSLKGKYSFQYIQDSVFEDCTFDTKDAFWHAKNVTVKNSVIKGEYLAWYAEDLTLIGCKIIGTQPLCYCKNLTLIDCEMEETDLCFERSEVQASVTTPVISIKNPYAGEITVPELGELIMDDHNAKGKVIVKA